LKLKNSFLAITFVCFLLILSPIYFAKSQTPSDTVVSVVPTQTSIQVGKTFVLNITLDNVENLYGLDLTLDYNSSVLQLVSVKPDGSNSASADGFLGTNSIPGGVLYGSPVTVDSNAVNSGCLYYNTSLSTIDEYHLFATSVNPASSFNGSGTIASLTFNVLASGHSDLTLNSTLADHPEPGETTSEAITHTDVSGSFDVQKVPEFPLVPALAIVLVLVTIALVIAKKGLTKASTQTR